MRRSDQFGLSLLAVVVLLVGAAGTMPAHQVRARDLV